MTLIVSWIGVDDKKHGKSIASIYFASDSRYTWGVSTKYNYAQKVFGSANSPEIFSFCGDVLFPLIILGQIVSQIDQGLMIQETDNAEDKRSKIFGYIETSLQEYPKDIMAKSFKIIYATRVEKSFYLYEFAYDSREGLISTTIPLPSVSTKVYSGGSGKPEFESNWSNCNKVKNNGHNTSRAVYHCLSETLKTINDNSTGGLPQIVGLFRIKNARLLGVVEHERKYIYGKEVRDNINDTNIEWRNGNFERIDHCTLKRKEGAQAQPF